MFSVHFFVKDCFIDHDTGESSILMN